MIIQEYQNGHSGVVNYTTSGRIEVVIIDLALCLLDSSSRRACQVGSPPWLHHRVSWLVGRCRAKRSRQKSLPLAEPSADCILHYYPALTKFLTETSYIRRHPSHRSTFHAVYASIRLFIVRRIHRSPPKDWWIYRKPQKDFWKSVQGAPF